MITEKNFPQLLEKLQFKKKAENPNLWRKEIGDSFLAVDFEKKKLLYPEEKDLIVNERQTCNFSQNENFVVFECVHRLLEKGYRAEDIELEHRWKARGASGGRADILVRHQENKNEEKKPLLVIECKTAGEEFDKEKKKMENNGGQLFFYLRQNQNVKYLCLYTSNFQESQKIDYQSAIVKIVDRDEDIKANEKDESIKLFRDANSKEELFEVWKETFHLYFHYNGIFENDVNAYNIELKPLKTKNLRPLEESQKIFNTFMEILRHHNISDNANAFNRILSLLLCKIVDENKGDDEILDFQVKEGEDTPEKIQDRLQKLYAQGMKEYLGQDIVYYEDEALRKIIDLYPQQTPIENLEEMFKEIKYYTHNEFAIKEVHNKELFEQNARIINEIIKMLQNYRFRYNKKQQILGDFFELLLNHGVKQSEGQFFTPIPVVRFIILSIGLDRIIEEKLANKKHQFLPKILDYSCGAGHFLTESIEEMQNHTKKLSSENYSSAKEKKIKANIKKYQSSLDWAKEYIFGIEKDYRLARTSQIACFLNGDGEANIIYGDGLENHDKLNLPKNFSEEDKLESLQQKEPEKLFDVVIANPPYAVKSFKNYLKVGEQYKLFPHLTEDSGEIETLFLERTAQVLKEGGRAGIIFPSPILSGGGIYEKAREILLEHFEIKAIAGMGGKTFGATGTNTIILFLIKRSNCFKKDRKYIAQDLFSGVKREKEKEYIDSKALLEKFLFHRGLHPKDYKTLLQKKANDNIQASELWKDYKEWFDNLTEIKNKKKKKDFLKKSKEEQQKELNEEFYKKILEKEEEKFYFFMLSLNNNHQPQRVILVQSGEKERAKAFLGYKFSERKGNEGIEISQDAKGNPTTKMYNDKNHEDPQKANSYILKNFWNEEINEIEVGIAPHLKEAQLTTMLDFSRTTLDKAISLNPQQKEVAIPTQWNVVSLGSVVKAQYGYTATAEDEGEVRYLRITDITEEGKLKNVAKKYIDPSDEIKKNFFLQEGDIVVARSGSIGRMFLYKNSSEKLIFASYLVRLTTSNKILPEYIFSFYNTDYYWQQVDNLKTTLAQPNLNAEKIKSIKIPLPPLSVQQEIVDECEKVDEKVAAAEQTILKSREAIVQQVQAILQSDYEMKRLGETFKTSSGGTPLSSKIEYYQNGTVPWINSGEVSKREISYADKFITQEGLDNSNAKIFPKKTVLLAMYGATAGKVALLNIEASTNQALCAFLPNKNIVSKFLLLILESMYKELLKLRTGVARDNLSQEKIKNIKIPIPPLQVQQKLVDSIAPLEQKIKGAQQTIENSAKEKEEILKKYL